MLAITYGMVDQESGIRNILLSPMASNIKYHRVIMGFDNVKKELGWWRWRM